MPDSRMQGPFNQLLDKTAAHTTTIMERNRSSFNKKNHHYQPPKQSQSPIKDFIWPSKAPAYYR